MKPSPLISDLGMGKFKGKQFEELVHLIIDQ